MSYTIPMRSGVSPACAFCEWRGPKVPTHADPRPIVRCHMTIVHGAGTYEEVVALGVKPRKNLEKPGYDWRCTCGKPFHEGSCNVEVPDGS